MLLPKPPGRPASARPIRERPYPLPQLPPDRYYDEPPDPALVGDTEVVFVEETDPFDQYSFRLERIIHQGKTPFQDVLIADTFNHGRALVLDGAMQSAEDDEEVYHEMLVQPAMLRHPDPRDVLIIGGGEGATLREVLAHASVRSATMVDLDAEVVELCREHLGQWHSGAFDDARARLLFADGRKFVEDDDRLYDVAIIDVVDMLDNGPAQRLYTRQFYQHLKRRMRPSGVVVVQGLEFSFVDDKPHVALSRTLRTVFGEVHSYRVHVPSFLGTWGFLVASDWLRPDELSGADVDRSIQSRLGTDWLSHVTGDFVKSAFVHCRETQFLLGQPGPILEDDVEFIPPPYIEDMEWNVRLPALEGRQS
ncbi:MAG: fused MFS/spermidine synthase [Myxococcota bacterium]|nr:fused MFS/spermidine synthase [Myxococcota bacterium]